MFKKKHSFSERQQSSSHLLRKYPDRIPVIVEKNSNKNKLHTLPKNKFLVPKHLTIGQFVYVIKQKLELQPEEAIFLFVNNTLPKVTDRMIDIYATYKDNDGYVYITYFNENTFG
jgi:GABA(A) receptor-associated protein|tara:strand:+ start:64 stop:408 length:345 start_codon:yes stop_codon:yes gene_type:complete